MKKIILVFVLSIANLFVLITMDAQTTSNKESGKNTNTASYSSTNGFSVEGETYKEVSNNITTTVSFKPNGKMKMKIVKRDFIYRAVEKYDYNWYQKGNIIYINDIPNYTILNQGKEIKNNNDVIFTNTKAVKDELFYDSKSWIVNVAGDTAVFKDLRMDSRFQPIDLNPFEGSYGQRIFGDNASGKEKAEAMTAAGLGKRYIDFITKDGQSDVFLKKLALKNIQKADIEFGSESILNTDSLNLITLLTDDYLPVLKNNYIISEYHKLNKGASEPINPYKPGKGNISDYDFGIGFQLFHVKINNEDALDIISSLGNPERYNQLPSYQIELVKESWNNFNFNEFDDRLKISEQGIPENISDEVRAWFVNELGNTDAAVRGVILSRNPAVISIGRNAGLKPGEFVDIYSQKRDNFGHLYSKKISTARVTKVDEETAHINFVNHMAGNSKNGDIAVISSGKNTSIGLFGNWTPHNWGGSFFVDFNFAYSSSGAIWHIIMSILELSVTDSPHHRFKRTDRWEGSGSHKIYEELRAPVFVNWGPGIGVSKPILGTFELMAYAQFHPEISIMAITNSKDFSKDFEAHSVVGFAFRIPLGLRLAFNLKYPTKIALEGGWAIDWGLGSHHKIVKNACKEIGVSRGGPFLNLGFLF